jgi:hypothetical protein
VVSSAALAFRSAAMLRGVKAAACSIVALWGRRFSVDFPDCATGHKKSREVVGITPNTTMKKSRFTATLIVSILNHS